MTSPPFERGEGYYYLLVEKPSNAAMTVIRHLPHDDRAQLNSNNLPRRQLKPSQQCEKVHFLADDHSSHVASQSGTSVTPNPSHVASQPGTSGTPDPSHVTLQPGTSRTPNPSHVASQPGTSRPPLKARGTYVSESSLEGSLSDMTDMTETDQEAPSQNCQLRKRLDSGLVPLNVKITPGESPYHCPQQITLYGGKPPQTWFYDQQSCPIPEPPQIPCGVSVPCKSLYICDTVRNGRCTERQTWINESGQGVRWMLAHETTEAKQFIDGEAYVFYVGEKGPHWVKQRSYITYKGRK